MEMSGRLFAEVRVDQRMALVVEWVETRVRHQVVAIFRELLHRVVGGRRVMLRGGHQSGGMLLLNVLQLSLMRIGGLMVVRQLAERMRRLAGLQIMRMVRGDCVMVLQADVLRVLAAAGDVLQARM